MKMYLKQYTDERNLTSLVWIDITTVLAVSHKTVSNYTACNTTTQRHATCCAFDKDAHKTPPNSSTHANIHTPFLDIPSPSPQFPTYCVCAAKHKHRWKTIVVSVGYSATGWTTPVDVAVIVGGWCGFRSHVQNIPLLAHYCPHPLAYPIPRF